jgi:alpha-galactosidase
MNHLAHPPSRLASRLLTTLVTLLASATGVQAQQPGNSPVKIFILAGQSNMEGQGNMSPVTTQGTLEYVVEHDRSGKYKFPANPSGGWSARDDVWIHYARNDGALRKGNLTAGYGVSDTTIGPELGFGWVVGDHYDNQVLLIKTAWGGKSLAVDFRPPSSGGVTGFYCEEMMRQVRDVTANLGTYFPGYNGQGYRIVGFGWHQGWNDRVNQSYCDEYEFNMANFIRDVRRYLRIAGLPFVIATTGMTGWDEANSRALSLMNAQLAVAQYPEFKDNVFTVETRGFWHPVEESPANQGYHWNRNAMTYLDIGLAMGEAMTHLADIRTPSGLSATAGPGGVTLTWQNGVQMPVSVRIYRNSVEIAGYAPVDPPVFIDTDAPPGTLEYELVFALSGGSPDPLKTTIEYGVTDYDNWASKYPTADLSDPDGDFDGDGMSNGGERIWGLDPTSGSSRNPITGPVDPTGIFSYTRRERNLTGLSYSVWTSSDLLQWDEDTGVLQTPGPPLNELETVQVTLSPGLLGGSQLFVQVRAAE